MNINDSSKKYIIKSQIICNLELNRVDLGEYTEDLDNAIGIFSKKIIEQDSIQDVKNYLKSVGLTIDPDPYLYKSIKEYLMFAIPNYVASLEKEVIDEFGIIKRSQLNEEIIIYGIVQKLCDLMTDEDSVRDDYFNGKIIELHDS